MKLLRLSSFILLTTTATFSLSQTEQEVNPVDVLANDHFGHDVSVNGVVAIAGAPMDNGTNTDEGSAYIFRFDGNNWIQEQKITASDAAQDDNFGLSVDIEDDVAVVGASFKDDNGSNSGAVYVFRFNGSSWIQEQKLVASDGEADDEFGHVVAISGDNILIGAYGDDDQATDAGAAYFFKYNGSIWQEDQKVSYSQSDPADFFGYSLDIQGNRAVIGAYLDDDSGVNSGSMFVYDYSGSWTQTQKLTASNGQTGDAFGFSVALWNDMIASGAYSSDGSQVDAGAVYIFSLAGTWSEDTILYASDAQIDDWLGYDIHLDSTTLMAGAFHNDDLGSESGSAYLFRYTGTEWLQELNLKADDGALGDEYGLSVCVSGMQVVVGSAMHDHNGTNSGSIYFYPMCTYAPSQDICMASVEHSTNQNELIWNKPRTTFIDSFRVFRAQTHVASTHYSTDGEYVDPTVNPVFGSHEYQLTTLNYCGVESDTSIVHKTVHLTGSGTGPFMLNWDQAEGFPFDYYRVWRDTGTGSFHLIYATLNSQFSYTDNYIPQNPPSYYIEMERGATCNSGAQSQTSAYSNVLDFEILDVKQKREPQVLMFPNPTLDNVNFKHLPTGTAVHIYDASGRQVLTTVYQGVPLNVKDLPHGLYSVLIHLETGLWSQKLIIR